MYLLYSRVRTIVKFPNIHQPDISVHVYGRNLVRLTMDIVGECDIWYIIAKRTSCQIW